MNPLKKFFETRSNPLNNPAVPLSFSGFLAWAMGGQPTAAGELVDTNTAMQQITVFSCIRILADGVASLPIRIFRQSSNGKQELITHPIARLLSPSGPNEEMTRYTFIESMVGTLMLTGNCYAEIQRNSIGMPIGLWPLNPTKTDVHRDSKTNTLYYTTTDGSVEGKVRRIETENMLHIPLFSFDGLKGQSPIQMARQAIGLAIAAEKFGAKHFGNGAVPTSGILTNKSQTLSVEQQKLIKQSWNQAQSGENQGRIAVLTGDWSYSSIGMSPEDSQFLQTRQFQRTEIASLFGISPSRVGDVSKQSKASAEQESLSFVTDTLRPILVRLELEFLRKLFPGEFDIVIEFDVSERLRGDFKTTMDGLAVAKQWGIYSTNQCLKILDQNPIGPVGDIYWTPVNMQNSELLLTTESIQDQPLPDQTLPKELPAPKEEKSLLAQYELAYGLLWRDCMGRLIHREKRDRDTVKLIFGPLLESISSQIVGQNGLDPAIYIDKTIDSITTRAADFVSADESGPTEFRKAIRTIYINSQRDLAALRADEETKNG